MHAALENLIPDKISLYRLIVIVVSITAIAIGCLYILSPFIPAILVATILALSAWPAFSWLETKLNHRTTLAAALMTVSLATCFLIPLVFLGVSMRTDFVKLRMQLIDNWQGTMTQAPTWLTDIPMIGPFIGTEWTAYARNEQSMIDALHINAGWIYGQILHYASSIGHGILDLSLGVLIAFFFFRHGLQTAQLVQSLIDKFGGRWGQHLLIVSKNTMIGVVYGILGTALAQGLLAAIGFWVADVPGAAFLGFLTVVLSFVPGGFPLIFIPVTLWLAHNGSIGMAIFMGIWGTAIICVMDFVVRPYFISLGSSLPLLLVLLGVFGGLIAFGFIGIFIGPTLLAVAYALVTELGKADKQAVLQS